MAEENQTVVAAAEPAPAAPKTKKVAKAPAKKAAAPKKAAAAKAASPAKKTPAAKKAPKTASAHPPYLDMIVAAITALKERGGSSRQAILKYILANYNVGTDPKAANLHLKQALKRGITAGTINNAKVVHLFVD